MDDIKDDATSDVSPQVPKDEEQKSTRDVIGEAWDKAVKEAEKAEAGEPVAKEKPAEEPVDEPVAKDKPAVTTEPTAEPAKEKAAVKAPQSWKPAVRERFATLDDEVKQEIARRESEINETLHKTSQERRVAQDFLTAIQPYQEFFQQQKIHPLQATQNMLNVAKTLYTGSKVEQATLLAQMVKHHGIDFKELDSAFERVFSGQQAPSIDPQLDARLRAIEEQTRHQQATVQQSRQAEINNTIETFAKDPKNEFFNDVVGHMQSLLSTGQANDLQDAYDQAIWANANVRRVLLERQSADKARQNAGNATLNNRGPRASMNKAPVKSKTTREILDELVPKDWQ